MKNVQNQVNILKKLMKKFYVNISVIVIQFLNKMNSNVYKLVISMLKNLIYLHFNVQMNVIY